MTLVRTILTCAGLAASLSGQGFDPAKLLQPPTDAWPTYSGDYTGRRFSPLKKINAGNINTLSLAWVYHMVAPGQSIKSSPIEINGVVYLTAPDHVWALDANTGREIWHHQHQSKGGIHIGNRGAAVSRRAPAAPRSDRPDRCSPASRHGRAAPAGRLAPRPRHRTGSRGR